jgi:hypothetical protein
MILLTQYELKKDLLPIIKQSLEKFVREISDLYGEKTLKINIHQLLHLTDDVKAWGLLWTHNSFIYESMNGVLTKMIHGTQSVPKAAVNALNNLQQMTEKEKSIQFQTEEASKLFEKFQQNSIK